MGADASAARFDHHQHGRLHAADLERSAAIDNAPGRKAERRVASDPCARFVPDHVYLWEDEFLEVLPGLGTPRYDPIKAITFHTRSTSKFYGDDYAVPA